MSHSNLAGFSIRDCREDDVAAVLQLWRQSGALVTATDNADDLRRAVVGSSAHVLVAELDGRVVGSIIGAFDGWRGNIYRLAVHPEVQRRGIARALLAEIENRLAKLGAKRMSALVAKEESSATGFWNAVGYNADPRLVRYARTL